MYVSDSKGDSECCADGQLTRELVIPPSQTVSAIPMGVSYPEARLVQMDYLSSIRIDHASP